jgi:putative tryptophan/tyrosine transport system substrate-binding protein
MKRFTVLAAIAVLCFFVSSIMAPSSEAASKVPRVGIIQLISHDAMDSSRKGFMDGLAEAGYVDGKTVIYDYQNAHGDISTLHTIAQKFARDNVDLIYALSTPAVQASSKATKTIPIVMGAITDPVAAGVVKSWQNSGNNITGIASKQPMDKTVEFYLLIMPKLKKLGVLYNPGERNSVDEVKDLEAVANQKGISLLLTPVTTSADVGVAASSLVGKVDAFVTPKDNTVTAGLEAGIKVARDHKIPFFSMDFDTVHRGTIIAFGPSFYDLGKIASKKAVLILKGEKPENIPISLGEKFYILINQKSALEQGVTIPKELLDKADKVIK